MDKEIAMLKKRLKEAQAIPKSVDRVRMSITKLPPFAGKARLTDKVSTIRTRAFNLGWDLQKDIEDLERALGRK